MKGDGDGDDEGYAPPVTSREAERSMASELTVPG